MGDLQQQALLELQDLSCIRDDRPLFQGLSATLNPGEIWRIEGPNGAGKTTLIRLICGLFSNFEGKILYQGEDLATNRYQFATNVLFIGHKTGIKPSLTAEENLRWMSGLRASYSQQEIFAALAQVGLRGYEDLPAYSLSAGQQRRIALARLYLESAPFWILDEPFTAIDFNGVAQLEQRLGEHAAKGGTVLLTTHHELSIAGQEVRPLRLQGTPAVNLKTNGSHNE